MVNAPIELSIVIVNFNTSQLTLECIRSIYQFPPFGTFEIIVVDNSSEQLLEVDLQALDPAIRFIRNGFNHGYANANNLGIHNSHGEFIMLLNSDTVIIEPIFDTMLDCMKEQQTMGVLGPRQVDGQRKYQLSCGHFPTLVNEIIRKIAHYRLSIDDYFIRDYLDERYAGMCRIDWVSGSCQLIRRRALQDTGLLDENFFMYFEDIDLCRRIQMKGWGVHYFPSATLMHYGGQSAKFNVMKVLVEYRRSQIYFTEKYYGRMGGFYIRFFLLIKYFLAAIKWGFIFLAARSLRKDHEHSYTMLLLSKKVSELCFKKMSHGQQVPFLPPVSQQAPLSVL